jgi:hypothetical protein
MTKLGVVGAGYWGPNLIRDFLRINPQSVCADGFEQKKGEVIIPQLEGGEPLLLECAHFLECIENGLRPRTDGLNGLRVVRVLEAAQESLKKGGTKQPLPTVSTLSMASYTEER